VIITYKEDFHFLTFRYFINHSTEEERFFNIDANTGTIKTSKVLDREETPWYNITVTASENGKLCYISQDRMFL
jgi:hypothetical protein